MSVVEVAVHYEQKKFLEWFIAYVLHGMGDVWNELAHVFDSCIECCLEGRASEVAQWAKEQYWLSFEYDGNYCGTQGAQALLDSNCCEAAPALMYEDEQTECAPQMEVDGDLLSTQTNIMNHGRPRRKCANYGRNRYAVQDGGDDHDDEEDDYCPKVKKEKKKKTTNRRRKY